MSLSAGAASARPLAVAIAGASGRMGRLLLRAVQEQPELALCAALVSPGSRFAGQPLSALGLPEVPVDTAASGQRAGAALRCSSDPGEALARAQVLIDFSLPQATAGLLEAAVRHGAAVVLGTTGLDAAAEERVGWAAARVPLLRSANMSLGVNLLLGLIAQASRALPGFDIEIIESHHRHKRDAPSGTALLLAREAARARGLDLEAALRPGRVGLSEGRQAGEIGVAAVRGGDVVGEHTVLLLGSGERVELTHRATQREVFAAGALRAARWLAGRPPGLYGMGDVLGLG